MLPRRWMLLALAVSMVALGAGTSARGQDLRSQARSLRAAIAAEEARIAATRDGLAEAERRLAVLADRAARRQEQLDETQDKLVRARVHLTVLERKEARAKRLLSANLLAGYKSGRPSFMTVVMDAKGFADLIERFDFLKRVSHNNANILAITRSARVDVVAETRALTALRTTYSGLAKAAIADRDQADVIRNALARREAAQLRARDGVAAKLDSVKRRIAAIEARQAAAARAARAAASATTQAPVSHTTGGGGGGDVVGRVVAAASQIASTPYVWGGGHGGARGGYDCSGSISYALAAAGLLSSPLDSTGFMSWGDAGPGRRITIYANGGHAFMVVDGRRYDTSALSGAGTRWTTAMRSTAGLLPPPPPRLLGTSPPRAPPNPHAATAPASPPTG